MAWLLNPREEKEPRLSFRAPRPGNQLQAIDDVETSRGPLAPSSLFTMGLSWLQIQMKLVERHCERSE